MLDLQFLCEHPDQVEENCRNRGVRVDVGAIVELARQRSQLIVEGDKHRHEQKEMSAQIPKTADAAQKQTLIERGKELRRLVSENEAALKTLEAELRPGDGSPQHDPSGRTGRGRRGRQPRRQNLGRSPQVRFPTRSTTSP